MRFAPTLSGVALAALLVVALTGCVQSTPAVIPTSQTSSKPVFASDADALAAAKKAYVAYLAVSDQILEDGGSDPQRLLRVATPNVLKIQLPGFDEAAKKRWHSTGGTAIDNIELQQFSPQASKGRSIVTVYACIDVRKVDVLDAKGHSVVSSTRPSASTYQATFDLASPGTALLVLSSEQPWSGQGVCS